MNSNIIRPEVEIDVQRLDSDIIDEHLRNSTVVLQDILKDKEDANDGNSKASSDEECSDDGHMCQHCGKIYKTASTLHAHYLLIHPENETEGKCVSCDKKYPSLLSLQKHIRYMHRYEHRCNACYRTFATQGLLLLHSETCSKTETPCSHCGKVFDSQLALRNHMKYKHPERKNHWCELCRRSFTTQRRLKNHFATIHPPGATDCTCCGKTFNSVTALKSHTLYKHTEDGSRCRLCHKAFSKKICLRKHCKQSIMNNVYIIPDNTHEQTDT